MGTLKVVRPVPTTIKVIKGSQPLGIVLGYREDISTHIEIKKIVPGAAETHNSTASPALQVKVGDFIESVNGSHTLRETLEQIKTASGEVELKLLKMKP